MFCLLSYQDNLPEILRVVQDMCSCLVCDPINYLSIQLTWYLGIWRVKVLMKWLAHEMRAVSRTSCTMLYRCIVYIQSAHYVVFSMKYCALREY